MKKLIALLMAMVLVLTAVSALADPYDYDSTKSVQKAFRNNNVINTDKGPNDDGNAARFVISYEADNSDGIDINLFVNERNASMYVWYVATVAPDKLADAYAMVNQLNNDYRYCMFVLDTSDNTITAEWFIYMIDDTFGEDVVEELPTLANIVDECLPKLKTLE